MARVSPDAMYQLHQLIRQKYALDVDIWRLRNVGRLDRDEVREKMERSDDMYKEILERVTSWDENPNNWREHEWAMAQEIRRRIERPGKRWWKENPPWSDD